MTKPFTDDSAIEAFPVKKTQIRFEAPPEMIFFEAEEAIPDEADFIRLDDLFRLEGVEPSATPLPQQETSTVTNANGTIVAAAQLPPNGSSEITDANGTTVTAAQLPPNGSSEITDANGTTVTAASCRHLTEGQESGNEPELPVSTTSASTIFTLIPRYRYQYIDSNNSRLIRRTIILSARKQGLKLSFLRVRPLFVQWQLDLQPDDDAAKLMNQFRDELEKKILTNTAKNRERHPAAPFWSDDCLILPAEQNLSDAQMIRFVNKYQLAIGD